MKKIIILLAVSIPALYVLYGYIFSDTERIKKLLEAGENAVILGDISSIDNILSPDFHNRDVFLNNVREFFQFHDVLEIKTVKREIQVEKRTAYITVIVLVTSNVKGLGMVTGKQSSGLELAKNTSKNDSGWKIIKVTFIQ